MGKKERQLSKKEQLAAEIEKAKKQMSATIGVFGDDLSEQETNLLAEAIARHKTKGDTKVFLARKMGPGHAPRINALANQLANFLEKVTGMGDIGATMGDKPSFGDLTGPNLRHANPDQRQNITRRPF